MLNLQILNEGAISINNPTIWKGFLHQMDNAVWRGCLGALKELSLEYPQYFQTYQITAIDQGLAALNKFDSYYDKVLDMPNKTLGHKKIAWACLMTIREVMNSIEGVRIPNEDRAKVKTQL